MSNNITFNYRLGTPNNLPTDGTYDLLLIAFPDTFPEGKIQFDLSETPRKITGIQKCAQTFLKILFTSSGSNVLYPTQGTEFQTLTVNANITVNDSVFASELSAQIKSAEAQTKYILNNSGSDVASQLQDVTILGLDVNNEAIIMYLKMVTKAGALAQVAIPFPQLDLALTEDKVT
jgi:hypothetical protein